MNPRSYELERLRLGLRPMRLHWFPRLGSTNTHAAAMRRGGTLFAPAVVLTGRQTAGRGRGGNAWWSGAGCITATFAFAADPSAPMGQTPLAAALGARDAAADAIDAVGASAAVQIKWPNDLVHVAPGSSALLKLAGLLCERVDGIDLIGLGLDVNLDPADAPAHLRSRVTSLSRLAGRPLDLTDTLLAVARRLRDRLSPERSAPFAEMLREFDSHHALIGRRVAVASGDGTAVSGRCAGLDESGRLLLRCGSTVHRVIAGQVTVA